MTNINEQKQAMLITRRYLMEQSEIVEATTCAYYNAYLLSNFGVVVDKPEKLRRAHVEAIAKLYRKTVPASFYKNPQDTKYYSRTELFLEQVLSYFLAYGAENSHVEIFKKDLPEYVEGDELKLRTFKILSAKEADVVFAELLTAYCAYKRPWSLDETNEVYFLYDNGYYTGASVDCGDNAIVMLERDPQFARFLFKKDLVKLSVARCGESKSGFTIDSKTKALFRVALPLAKNCPMSKKQAKYFNKLLAECGVKAQKASNADSIERKAKVALDAGDVVGAAKIYAASGSLLERHIKMLLSRANIDEAGEILDLISSNNPLALYQMASTLSADGNGPRTFTFTKNKRVKRHVETAYEAKWRKSRLTVGQVKQLYDTCIARAITGYQTMPTIGKVYVADNFFKVAAPINTSASGRGIDVLPIGSRVAVRGKYIRTFVHWENAFDIDASLIFMHQDGTNYTMNFTNYRVKHYGNAALFSGDVTSPTGTEYYDLDLEALRRKGVTKIVQTFHGFCSNLNSGEIYCGYQNKDNLNTKAWDPKNIEMKMHVKGDSRACVAFAFDLETNEVVILNQILDCDERVANAQNASYILKYLDPASLALNIGEIASARAAEVVATPDEAEIVFADDYVAKDGQKVIRSFDVETLAALAVGQAL